MELGPHHISSNQEAGKLDNENRAQLSFFRAPHENSILPGVSFLPLCKCQVADNQAWSTNEEPHVETIDIPHEAVILERKMSPSGRGTDMSRADGQGA